MGFGDEEKNYRKALYFDLICGIVCSTSALAGIIYVSVMHKIANLTGWLAGLTFWILYLIFSLFLISMGVYTWWKENHYDDQIPRKDLKPPIV
jgi:Na+/proline symporter